MSDRFEELLARLLDDELSQVELSELTDLVRNDPSRQAELQSQLEAAEMLVLAEDELHTPERFLVGLRTADEAVPDGFGPVTEIQERKTSSFWWATPLAAAAVLVLAFLLWPSDAALRSIATIQSLHGEVQWTGDGGQLHEAQPGQRISGGTIETLSADAWTVVEFLDGSVITVLGRSELAVTEDDEGRKILRLNDGVMSVDVQPQPQGCPMIVRTPTAEMEVVGTQFNVDAKALETRLAVNEGLVRLRRLSDGESVDVEAQHQVVASIDEPEQLKASPRGSAVFSWKSDLKSDVRHGSWVSDIELLAKKLKVAVKRGELTDMAASVRYKKAATLSDSGSVWATPFLAQKPQGKLFPKSLVLLSATGRSHPAVITGTSTFRIRGTLYGSPHSKLVFGISTNRKSGGFFGKFITEVAVTESGEPFDAETPVSTFKHVDTRHGMSPDQKELAAVWCVVEGGKTKLRFSSVELLPGTAASVGQDQQD